MKAMPARKKSRWVTSTAAARLRTRPVDRDRVRRQPRLDQPVAGVAAPLGRRFGGCGRAAARAARRGRVPVERSGGRFLRRARAAPRPGVGAQPGEQARGDQRARQATSGAGGGVEPVVVARSRRSRRRRAAGRRDQSTRGEPVADERSPRSAAIISEKAMCMLGTAAYGLTQQARRSVESWLTPVKAVIVSMKPSLGEHPRRRGRVERVADQREAHRDHEHVADEVEVLVAEQVEPDEEADRDHEVGVQVHLVGEVDQPRRVVEQRLLEAGLEEGARASARCRSPGGAFANATMRAGVGDPADDLVALVGEEEEAELAAPHRASPFGQQTVDRRRRAHASRAIVKGGVTGSA